MQRKKVVLRTISGKEYEIEQQDHQNVLRFFNDPSNPGRVDIKQGKKNITILRYGAESLTEEVVDEQQAYTSDGDISSLLNILRSNKIEDVSFYVDRIVDMIPPSNRSKYSPDNLEAASRFMKEESSLVKSALKLS